MNIKILDLDHIEAMLEIEKENFTFPWDFKTMYYELALNKNTTFLGAFINDKLVGYLGYWLINDNIDLINIAISKDYKRQGIATKLFDSMLLNVKHLNVKTITLEVNVNNVKAISLYEKLGFTKVRVIKNYYYQTHEDAYMMQKETNYDFVK